MLILSVSENLTVLEYVNVEMALCGVAFLSLPGPAPSTHRLKHILRSILVNVSTYVFSRNTSILYSATCLVSTLKGTPNLYFLSEVLTISTG